MSYESIVTETRDGVVTITLHRPERMNAWTHQMASELRLALTRANEDDAVGAIVLTGAGRGFCAGADVEAVFKAQADGDLEGGGRNDFADWVHLLRESKPIVAAVNGAAIGLGLTMILPMDFIVASTDAKFSLRFVKMGVVPELGSSRFLLQRCGFGHASELMMTGRTVGGEEALSLGLADRIVAADALLDEACGVATAMGENPASSLRMIKQLITANSLEADIDLVQRREADALARAFETPEHQEAIAAFLEKRPPDFRAARERLGTVR